MAKYLVNKRGVAKARKLIDDTEVMLAAHKLLVYLDKSRK